MTKGCCFSNKLVQYVLRKVEANSDYVFTESDLIKESKKDFDSLKKDKWFLWEQFDYDSDIFFSSKLGDQTTPRRLTQRKDGKYWADSEEEGIGRIVVEEKDIPHWKFDFSKLIEFVAKKNSLEDSISSVSDVLWFVGCKELSGDRVGIFLSLSDSVEDMGKELKGLPSAVGKYVRYVALSPFERIVCQKTLNALNGISVSHAIFADAFNDDFKFKSKFLFAETKPELPKTLHLTGRFETDKHIVSLDNKEGGLTDANFKILLDLVVALKKTKDGWVQTGDGDWQAFGRLKDDFKRTFDRYDFRNMIVNGRKKYRLALLSENVTYDRAKLKKIKDNAVITELAGKLPVIRKKGTDR